MMRNIIQRDKGYTLLFAMIVASIVLAIGVTLLDISRKEFILSSSATDSSEAFYAADSGAGCAAYWDKNGSNDFSSSTYPIGSTNDYIQCISSTVPGESQATINPIGQVSANSDSCPADAKNGCYEFSFSAPFPSNGNDSVLVKDNPNCVTVSVDKYQAGYTDPNTGITTVYPFTTITSSGYNIGWTGTDCSSPSPKKVERTIVYTY